MNKECKPAIPKEVYKLRIEQIRVLIYDLRNRYSKPIDEILEDISVDLYSSKFIITENQSSLFQFQEKMR